MSGWCSMQNGVTTTAPEHRKWRRVHGLQPPLHPQQVAGWVALALFAAASFAVLIPALTTALQPPVAAALATLLALHLVAHLAALLLDPADPELRRLRPATAVVPEFDRSKHAHVIENGRCHLCNIETSGPRTKHCSVCNKCVAKFDHHCKWLNHCIGGRNYPAFLVCVVSAVAACLVIVAMAVTELVFYHVDPGWLDYPWTDHENAMPQEIFLIIVGFVGTLAAVTAGLLLHLCLFHVYISVLGITTYEYIRNYRQLSSSVAANNRTTTNLPRTNQCWNQNRSLAEAGVDKKCSIETIEGTLRRDLQNDSRNCLTASESDSIHRHNGFKGYPVKATMISDRGYVKPPSGSDRRVCNGCRYCSNRTKHMTNGRDQNSGLFSNICGSGSNRNDSSDNSDYKQSSVVAVPRRNQVRPSDSRSPPRRSASLPALPPPVRRQMQSVSLKELGDVLAYVQQQPALPPGVPRRTPPRRYIRRKSIPTLRPTMSPTLSPIHESGLSNPGTPQPAPKPKPLRHT